MPILVQVGAGLGKPGRPYVVSISLKGYFSDKTVFEDHGEERLKVVLGDPAVPYGLWKSIEHMRKGERALIMVKPKHGYGREEEADRLKFPSGWDTPEQRAVIARRRLYYEVTLHEWFVRHDLDGDGLLIKNILEKGEGYDRPDEIDEVTFDLRVYQVAPGTREERVL